MKAVLRAALLAVALSSCGGDSVAQPSNPVDATEWISVPWSGGVVRVALLRPDPSAGPGPHPVVFALPWGSGTADLVLGLLDTYWSTEPAARGYYVVAPQVLGSSLRDTAGELFPAIFDWMDRDLDYDPGRVALTGASNGGRGVFFAATAVPDRFQALIGMPGRYEGDGSDLGPLQGKRVRLLVGERDTGWVQAARDTESALTAGGIDVTLEVVEGQDHVLILDPVDLMDWIDEALGS